MRLGLCLFNELLPKFSLQRRKRPMWMKAECEKEENWIKHSQNNFSLLIFLKIFMKLITFLYRSAVQRQFKDFSWISISLSSIHWNPTRTNLIFNSILLHDDGEVVAENYALIFTKQNLKEWKYFRHLNFFDVLIWV